MLAWLCGHKCQCLLLQAKGPDVKVTFGCEHRSDSGPSLNILSGAAALEYDLVLPSPEIAKRIQFRPPSLIDYKMSTCISVEI